MAVRTKTELKALVGTVIRTPVANVTGKVEKASHANLEDDLIDSLVDQEQLQAAQAGVKYVVAANPSYLDLNTNPNKPSTPSANNKALYNNHIWQYSGTTWVEGAVYILDENSGLNDKIDKFVPTYDEMIVVTNLPTNTNGTNCVQEGNKKISDLLVKLSTGITNQPIPYVDVNGQLQVSSLKVSDFTGVSNWNIFWNIFTDKVVVTPATDSTITTTPYDLTSTIYKGYGLRYKMSGTYYYGIVTNISSTTITIGGYPLTTGSASIEEIAYCFQNNVMRQDIEINNSDWLTTPNADILKDGYTAHPLEAYSGYLVYAKIWCRVADSGTKATIQVKNSTNAIFSSALTYTAAKTFYNTGVTANTYYEFSQADPIRIDTTSAGNKNTSEAKIELYWVLK